MASQHSDCSNEPTKVASPGIALGHPLILDRYRVMGVLGTGGMGTVYQALHVRLERYVAVKTLRPEFLRRRPGLVHRFLREMAAIGQLDHVNVVRATDAGETNGVLHLVMDFLPGRDVGQLANDYGCLQPADACEIVRQAAVGLHYIHRTMVHRDVKPSNLMLTELGVVKILDLGLARLHEWGADHAMTPHGCVLGTYDFMAPEQAAGGGGDVDGRADIYSLGCTFFRLLTGRVPFGGSEFATHSQKLLAHQTLAIQDAEGFSAVPPELRPVMLRMTAKDPGDRYADAGEVAAALAPFARHSDLISLGANASCVALGSPLSELQKQELALLTESPPTTAKSPVEIVQLTTLAARVAPTRKPRRVVKAGAAGIALAAAIAASVMLVAPGTIRGIKPTDSGLPIDPPLHAFEHFAGRNPVDHLKLNAYHPMFKTTPQPLTGITASPETWTLDADAERLDVWSPGEVLLQFGTTASPHFAIEASITQTPWSGNVGIFWGYREYPNADGLRATRQRYASCQLLYLYRVNTLIKPVVRPESYNVMRATLELFQNQAGEIHYSIFGRCRHTIVRPALDTQMLVAHVDHNHLVRGVFGGVELNLLLKDEDGIGVNRDAGPDGFGTFTYGCAARFQNFRFISTAKPSGK